MLIDDSIVVINSETFVAMWFHPEAVLVDVVISSGVGFASLVLKAVVTTHVSINWCQGHVLCPSLHLAKAVRMAPRRRHQDNEHEADDQSGGADFHCRSRMGVVGFGVGEGNLFVGEEFFLCFVFLNCFERKTFLWERKKSCFVCCFALLCIDFGLVWFGLVWFGLVRAGVRACVCALLRLAIVRRPRCSRETEGGGGEGVSC